MCNFFRFKSFLTAFKIRSFASSFLQFYFLLQFSFLFKLNLFLSSVFRILVLHLYLLRFSFISWIYFCSFLLSSFQFLSTSFSPFTLFTLSSHPLFSECFSFPTFLSLSCAYLRFTESLLLFPFLLSVFLSFHLNHSQTSLLFPYMFWLAPRFYL